MGSAVVSKGQQSQTQRLELQNFRVMADLPGRLFLSAIVWEVGLLRMLPVFCSRDQN